MTAEGACGEKHFIKYNCCLVHAGSPKTLASFADTQDLPPLTSRLLFFLTHSLSPSAFYLFPYWPFCPLPPRVHYFLLNNANRTMSCWLQSVNTGLINQAKTQWLPSLHRSPVFPLVSCVVRFLSTVYIYFWETKLLNQTGIAALLSYLNCNFLLYSSFLTRNLWNGALHSEQLLYF